MAGSEIEDLSVGCVRKARRKGAVSDDGRGLGLLSGEIEGQCLIRTEDRRSEGIEENRV